MSLIFSDEPRFFGEFRELSCNVVAHVVVHRVRGFHVFFLSRNADNREQNLGKTHFAYRRYIVQQYDGQAPSRPQRPQERRKRHSGKQHIPAAHVMFAK